MRYVQRRLYPAAAMRVTMTLCPCEYDCGGLELTVVGTDVSGNFPVIPYAQAVAELGPIKVAENRPV